MTTMLGLLDALNMPVWLRSADGRLKWVNRAYADAVEADDRRSRACATARSSSARQARDAIAAPAQVAPVFEQTLSTVIEGDRRMFAVTDFAGADGSAGIACRHQRHRGRSASEYERTVRSHADTLDQLTTAVAIFDADEKLRFFNQAFQKLWDLDSGFLAQRARQCAAARPAAQRRARSPSSRNGAAGRRGLLGAYRAVEPQEHWWHLPDGRTIRVVANPQPKGGVTWVFENLTEKIDLESRYKTAVRVQGETLDNLAEGVAVFGPDGRLRLSNPAFAKLWGLSRRCRQAQHACLRRSATRCDLHGRRQSLGRASSPPSPASTTSAATATARPSSRTAACCATP